MNQSSNLAHVELYVGDAVLAAFYYRRALGFRVIAQCGPETGCTDRRSILLEQGTIRLLLTSALSSAGPVADYVARHGDGVRDIAMYVPDVERAYRHAVQHGARSVVAPTLRSGPGGTGALATVQGFGSVVHTFLSSAERDELPDPLLLPVEDPAPAGPHLRAVDHFAVCLPAGDLAHTIERYVLAFGFEEIFEEFIEVGDQAMNSKVVRDPASGVTLTIIEPDHRYQPGQIDGFLTAHGGAGVQHIAFSSPDIDSAVRALATTGVEFLTTPAAYYDRLAGLLGPDEVDLAALRETNVLADQDEWGTLLQIFTRSPYARATLFLELIERRGARTFGSGNIKGLYESVQRDRETRADALADVR